MDYDVNPEERASEGIGPPEKYTVPLLQDSTTRCVGCPYPSVGFICWGPEGSCMKTELDKISRRSKGR